MRRTLAAAAAYFALVFSAAFVMGVVRNLVVAPRTGEVAAVLIETPLILAVSWFAAGWSIRRFRIPLLETLPPDLYPVDWQQQNSSFFNALQVERNVMFLILTLIILVAAFNIISSLIMLVKDKNRDIAVLRTMGATRGMITRVFFMTGASVGVLGTAFGSALGLLFCENIEAIRQALQTLLGVKLFDPVIYFLSKMPAEVDPWEVGSVILMALLLSFAATIYPAWRAARVDPVEALRYE